jgi:uncharacterized BrkB/YihY/UPF0761 family membrane protein
MADPEDPDRNEPPPLEVDIEPTVAGRLARWLERARILGGRIEAARAKHSSVEVGFGIVERDASIGGGLLAGALAYRVFVLLLPTAVLFVSGLGLYAGTVDKSTSKVAEEAGLHGLIASEVASASAGRARALVFLLMVPAVVYATVALYRSLAKVHAIVWLGTGRGVRVARRGVVVLAVALVLELAAVETVGLIRRSDQFGVFAALLVYLVLVGGAWLALSMQLPHRDVRWYALLPGAVLFGAGLFLINGFNVYVTTRLVEGRSHTYGTLGIAAALLFSLVLVGRLAIVSAELNAALDDVRSRPSDER